MRPSIHRAAPLLALLAVATPSSAATLTPAVTPPTPGTSPTAITSPTSSPPSSATFVPSPSPTRRWTPVPSPSRAAATVEPTPVPDAYGDEASAVEMPSPQARPTEAPAGVVRAFRTPERADPPAFVAPQPEPTTNADDAQADAAAESEIPADRPYVATVTFSAVASTDVDGFELVVIYPRSAGEFVGDATGVDCRKTGDAMLFADDRGGGTLRLLVASNHPLTFPFDVVCKFTVQPNATLQARLIAVNVAEVTAANKAVEPSALTISVSAH